MDLNGPKVCDKRKFDFLLLQIQHGFFTIRPYLKFSKPIYILKMIEG